MTIGQRSDRPEHSGGVIVGIDGSASSAGALAWAAARASLLGPVVPVAVSHVPGPLLAMRLGGRSAGDLYHRTANVHLAEAIAGLRADCEDEHQDDGGPAHDLPIDVIDGLSCRARVMEGRPGPALCEAATGAALLVVGTRGRRGATAGLLGSVSSYCARHTPVPLVVVPADRPQSEGLGLITVGVDGSRSSAAALRWAIEHAEPGARIEAVGAAPLWGSAADDPAALLEAIERHVRATVASVLAAGADSADGPPGALEIIIRVDRRDARVALRDRDGPAPDLVVVGARGLTELPFLVLGSVSSALIHHPRVPTVVVPDQRDQK